VKDSSNHLQESFKSDSSVPESGKILVFSIDDRFIHHLSAALNSIIANNTTPIQVIVLCFGVAEENLRILQSYQRKSIKKLTLIEVGQDTFANLHETLQFPRASYGRFMAPRLVSSEDHLLYLDADIIVLQDLGEIFEIDLMEHPVGGISNIDQNALQRMLGEECEGGYLDSGLLLFNVRKWQEDNLSEEIVKKVLESGHLWSTPDNHGLNFVLKGNFKHIPRKYSYQTHYYFTFPETREESEVAHILQFAGPVKPDSYLCTDYFKSVYAYHLLQTPFGKLLDSDKSLKNLIKRYRNGMKIHEKQ
jgi:lipopolysaccharide biosynthesis glycosyltransferase